MKRFIYKSDKGTQLILDSHEEYIYRMTYPDHVFGVSVLLNAYETQVTAQSDTIAKLREALKPFTHDDLCSTLGGNVEGEESIIFARNKAVLKLKDTIHARAILEESK